MPNDMGAGSAFTMVGRDFISNTRCAGKTAAGTVGGGGTPNTPTPTTGLTATNTPTPNTQVKRKSIKWTDSSGGICSTIWSANSCSEGISNWPGSNNPCTVSGNSISIPGNDRLLHCQYYECNACSASCDTYSRQIGSDIDSKNNCTYTCSESGITSTGAGCATQTPTPSPTSVPNATPTATPTGTVGATATPSPTMTLTPSPVADQDQIIRTILTVPDDLIGKVASFSIEICPKDILDDCKTNRTQIIFRTAGFTITEKYTSLELQTEKYKSLVKGKNYVATISITIDAIKHEVIREFAMSNSPIIQLDLDLSSDGLQIARIGTLASFLDIDGSGNITTLDFARVIRQYGKTWELAGGILAEDVNLDGRVNAVDISLIIHNIGNSVSTVSVPQN